MSFATASWIPVAHPKKMVDVCTMTSVSAGGEWFAHSDLVAVLRNLQTAVEVLKQRLIFASKQLMVKVAFKSSDSLFTIYD